MAYKAPSDEIQIARDSRVDLLSLRSQYSVFHPKDVTWQLSRGYQDQTIARQSET